MPYANWGFLALRVALGLVFIYHGMGKMMMPKMMSEMMGKMGVNVGGGGMRLWGLLELLAGLSVLLGIYEEWGAVVTGLVALGAIYYKTFRWKVKFAAGAEPTGGWEFDLVNLGASVLLLLAGGGSLVLVG